MVAQFKKVTKHKCNCSINICILPHNNNKKYIVYFYYFNFLHILLYNISNLEDPNYFYCKKNSNYAYDLSRAQDNVYNIMY